MGEAASRSEREAPGWVQARGIRIPIRPADTPRGQQLRESSIPFAQRRNTIPLLCWGTCS
ncbi:unnamed protein product, partial [Nesidiocoris tenuis]